MNTYEYQIQQLITNDVNQGRPNAVCKVLTVVTATSPDGRQQSLNVVFDILQDINAPFTDFSQLTQEQVRAWIDAAEDQWVPCKRDLDMLLDEPISLLVARDLPWLPSQEEMLADIQAHQASTTAISTTTRVIPSFLNSGTQTTLGSIDIAMAEEYIKALVYQVLEEVKSSQV